MVTRYAKALLGLFLGFALVPSGMSGADQLDAVSTTSLSAAKVDSGTVQVLITAVIRESMGVEFTTPMTLGAPETPDQDAAANLVLANTAGRFENAANRNPELSASIAIRGTPNQTFAVSLPVSARLESAKSGTGVAVFTHDAGTTPRIGPEGDTKFVIAARIDFAQNMPVSNYTGTLDVIVSHN